jgi:hypothetical protein
MSRWLRWDDRLSGLPSVVCSWDAATGVMLSVQRRPDRALTPHACALRKRAAQNSLQPWAWRGEERCECCGPLGGLIPSAPAIDYLEDPNAG